MIVSEPGRLRLSALAVGAFVAGLLAMGIVSPAQKVRSDDEPQSPATSLSLDENPSLRTVVERLARERYLFLKRLNQNLDQGGFFGIYALFPVGRYDSVYILSVGVAADRVDRYDHKEGRDKLIYSVRLRSTWNEYKGHTKYKGRTTNLLQVIKYHYHVSTGKISRFAKNDLSRDQEMVQYTWIPYNDMVESRLSSRLNDEHAFTWTAAGSDPNSPESSLLTGAIVKENGLPISKDELAIIKKRYSWNPHSTHAGDGK